MLSAEPLDDFLICSEILIPFDDFPARLFGHDIRPAMGANS